ncbi:MAG: RHS repeat-associated core domain-containing protein [Pseudomonadota bacterium]
MIRTYTGHIADTATGLTYMKARYYDPEIGRFYVSVQRRRPFADVRRSVLVSTCFSGH